LRVKRLAEHRKYVGITGYRNVRIKNVEEFLRDIRKKIRNTTLQFLDAKFVAGWDHLFFAVLNALTAFKSGRNISNSLAIEILLFASAQRQIKQALHLLGIKPETSEVAVVIVNDKREKIFSTAKTISESLHGLEDDSVLEISEEKFDLIRWAFNINDEELKSQLGRRSLKKDALVELVIEHVALLATQR
jgi:tRNA threonylcarbamoyladenosine modification (KEOPS) complex Cgi121 subunit